MTETTASRSRTTGFVGSVALLTLSFALALAGLELAVRLAAPQQLIVGRPDIWIPTDSVGYRFRPNIDVTINTGDRAARIVTDSAGFRIGVAPPRQPAKRILLIGDSFMAALQVDHEQSLAGRMETDLREPLGAKVAVRNAGVAGWNPPQYRTFLRSQIDREPYDLLLVATYLGNDIVRRDQRYVAPFEQDRRSDLRMPRSVSPAELIDAIARPINDRLEEHSHLYVLLKNRLGVLRMRLGLTALYFPDGFRLSDADSPMWDVSIRLLAELGDLAQARGIPVLYVLLPTDFQVQPAIFDAYVEGFDIEPSTVDLEQPNRRLAEGLRRRGFRVLDALPALRAAERAGRRTYGRVDNHFSAEGHAVVWELLRDDVEAALGRPLGS